MSNDGETVGRKVFANRTSKKREQQPATTPRETRATVPLEECIQFEQNAELLLRMLRFHIRTKDLKSDLRFLTGVMVEVQREGENHLCRLVENDRSADEQTHDASMIEDDLKVIGESH